jgi:hypothetical protein
MTGCMKIALRGAVTLMTTNFSPFQQEHNSMAQYLWIQYPGLLLQQAFIIDFFYIGGF